MKKALLFTCAIAFLAFTAGAQITLNSGNIVDIDDVVCQAFDTIPGVAITPGSAGASQTWDFSSLVAHDRDTMRFMDPAVTPYDTAFTGDNVGALFVGDATWAYFYKSPTLLETMGMVGDLFGTGTIAAVEINPRETLMQFPFTYLDSFIDTSGIEIIMDTIKVSMTTVKTIEADAWGSITTPAGTFNCLRLFSTKIETQVYYMWVVTTWVPVGSNTDTTYHYEWWTDNTSLRFPAASLSWDMINSVVDGEVEFLEETFVAVPLNETPIVANIYPNPSEGLFNIEAGNISSLQVINMNGKVIMSSSYSFGVNSLRLDLRNQPEGIYLLRVNTAEGMIIRKIVLN
ncbi:MAG: T9SS type A sorting domain-containing protein, partial [Bacteroidota bacterium]